MISTSLFIVGALGLGLIMGSFLSMLIPRLHEDKKGIVSGRSECPHCGKILSPLELIPLLSYVLLRGRCRHCKKAISLWYPLTELSSSLLFGVLYLQNPSLDFLWLAPLFLVLLFIFFYDLRYKEIHDAIMIPGILYATLAAWHLNHLQSSLIGGVIAFIFFALQYGLSRGRWIGSGDLRIGLFMGLILGWQKTLLALLLSYLIGSAISIILLLTNKASGKTAVPLGPFLVLGTLLSFFWGEQLLAFYLSL